MDAKSEKRGLKLIGDIMEANELNCKKKLQAPCSTCLSYGLWPIGEPVPLGQTDSNEWAGARLKCPECGAGDVEAKKKTTPQENPPTYDHTYPPSTFATIWAQYLRIRSRHNEELHDLERRMQRLFKNPRLEFFYSDGVIAGIGSSDRKMRLIHDSELDKAVSEKKRKSYRK